MGRYKRKSTWKKSNHKEKVIQQPNQEAVETSAIDPREKPFGTLNINEVFELYCKQYLQTVLKRNPNSYVYVCSKKGVFTYDEKHVFYWNWRELSRRCFNVLMPPEIISRKIGRIDLFEAPIKKPKDLFGVMAKIAVLLAAINSTPHLSESIRTNDVVGVILDKEFPEIKPMDKMIHGTAMSMFYMIMLLTNVAALIFLPWLISSLYILVIGIISVFNFTKDLRPIC